MDREILKLFPQKAFKLLSIKDSIRIGSLITKSLLDKKSYEVSVKKIDSKLNLGNNSLSTGDFPKTKENGEEILKIYFSQFYNNQAFVHLDLRPSSFYADSSNLFWIPSKLHYRFNNDFLKGVQSLYDGFYFDRSNDFEEGLRLLGMIRKDMDQSKRLAIIELFTKHFGEGKNAPVEFSLKKLQESFNAIFTFFLKEDIPLNPEFAVLGISLVTLYLTLQEIPFALNVKESFLQVRHI